MNALAKSLQDVGHEVVQSPDDADLEQLFKLIMKLDLVTQY